MDRRSPIHWLRRLGLAILACILVFSTTGLPLQAQAPATEQLDARVEKFLKESRGKWQDLNVPYQDGRVLHDLIVKNRFTRVLEIGTSTGHSAIWIAWALSKTGGRLVTIEIDEERHRQALQNFRKAGVDAYIDARLADAHQLVKELNGPFDFVFADADKEWSTQYFKDVDPKLLRGGCFASHNAIDGYGGIKEFLDYVGRMPNYDTHIDRTSSSGISVSCKK